jgi:hypothetical protein
VSDRCHSTTADQAQNIDGVMPGYIFQPSKNALPLKNMDEVMDGENF